MKFRAGLILGAVILAVLISSALSALVSSSFPSFSFGEKIIRVGYFPNITHSQAVIGMAKGAFQKELGDDVKIDVKIFNAGPSVIEAIFAGALDVAYIGPNPAINGYIKSDGDALRIIAGASSGGAGLVVRKDSGILKPEDFHGKRIASPQLGNTQDVALRAWLKDHGLLLKEKGGDVVVYPLANPDQLTLFLKKEIDGAWTVEPWVSRLIKEADGRLYLDERELWPHGEFVTANIIVSRKFLDKYPLLVKRWLKAHVELTQWINQNPREAKTIVNAEIRRLTGAALDESVLKSAFDRMKVTYDPIKASLRQSANAAFDQGFLGDKEPDLKNIYSLELLNEVLDEEKLKRID
jgi:NitT/TauT family transport system substrate-binding protein